jgi:transforming growth factor-beta-induced protein
VTIDGKTVKIGDATVTTADLECSNGVIHVIDKVLLPPAPVKDTPNIVQLGEAAGNFNTLVAAVKAAGLTETLSGAGPFTVFAPTDTAFEAALKALGITAEEALKLPNLGDILKFHVASGKVMSTDLSNGMKVPTLEGSELTVTIDGKTVKIGDATVTQADVEASNGVIHIIDKVLLPPSPTTTVAPGTSDGDAAGSVDAASGGSARGFGGLLLAIALLARRV